VLKVDPQGPLASEGGRCTTCWEAFGRRPVSNVEELQSAIKSADTSGSVLMQLRRGGRGQQRHAGRRLASGERIGERRGVSPPVVWSKWSNS